MRKLIIALTMLTTPAMAETVLFYGDNGQDIGMAQSAGTSAFYYDRDGNNVGTSLKAGNTTYFYGNNGEVFSAQRVGPRQ